MGDKLERGWADAKARDPNQWQDSRFAFEYVRRGDEWRVTALGAPSLNPTESEVQAEDDMLP